MKTIPLITCQEKYKCLIRDRQGLFIVHVIPLNYIIFCDLK